MEDVVDEALAVWGLKAESKLDLDEEFWLWPENEVVFGLWLAIQTQWYCTEQQRTGLNYHGVQIVLSMYGVSRADRPRYFGLLQAMEIECLNTWANQKN